MRLNNLGIFFNGDHPPSEIERITRLLNAKIVKMLCSDSRLVREVAQRMPDVMVVCRFWWQNDTFGDPNTFRIPNLVASLALDEWLRTCVNLAPLHGLGNVWVESMNEIGVAHGDDFAIKAGYMTFERERCYHHEKYGFHAAVLNTGVGRDIDISLAADYDLLKAVEETDARIAVHGYGSGVGIDAAHGEFQLSDPDFNDLDKIFQHRSTREILPVREENTWLAFRAARLMGDLRRSGFVELQQRIIQTEFGIDDVVREYNGGVPYTSKFTAPREKGEPFPDGWRAWSKWWKQWGWLKSKSASEFYAEELAWGAAQLAEYGIPATVFADSTGEWENFDSDGTDLYEQLSRKLATWGQAEPEPEEPPIVVTPPDKVYVTPKSNWIVNIRQLPTTSSKVIGGINPNEPYEVISARRDDRGNILWYRLALGGYVSASVVNATAGYTDLPDAHPAELINEVTLILGNVRGLPALIDLAHDDLEKLQVTFTP